MHTHTVLDPSQQRIAVVDNFHINRTLIRSLRRFLYAFPVAALLFGGDAVAAEEPDFVVHPDNPVLPVGPSGAWDAAFVDPAAVIYQDGTFHSFYAGVPSWPYDLAIGHASSPDGVNWTRSGPDAVLTGSTANFETQSINSNSVIVTDDGQWMLYFTIATHGSFKGSIGRAVAPSPTGPWSIDPEPVLQPGPKGAWDHRGIGNASVVQSDSGYVMYYSGEGMKKGEQFSTVHNMIGLARSKDGVTWTKNNDKSTTDERFRESAPIMQGGETNNNWAKEYVTDPNVQKTADGWAMVFRGGDGKKIGYATSKNGVDWEPAFEGPILEPHHAGVSQLYFVSFIHRDGSDYVYFEGGSYNSANGFLAIRRGPSS